ncbi:MAG: family 78 glycoside hydrolase catalytic domain [Clostridia bacterium]|nr:family 78 glycoside hydrolase catalytic domain [Clostridia bacterium]
MKLSTRFIKATNEVCDFDHFVPAPYFRKNFTLDFQPEKAEITICGLGFYELYVNGKHITKGALAPYISNIDHLCYYDNYEIASLLTPGENVIGVILGNGFRNCWGGFAWGLNELPGRGPVTLALCLEAEDNTHHFELEADESFLTHPSPILHDDLRMGYDYDARREIPNWNLVDFDDSAWSNALPETTPIGKKLLCDVEPIAVTDEIQAIEIKHFDRLPFAYNNYEKIHFSYDPSYIPADDDVIEPLEETYRNNVYVYDFGKTIAGVPKLKINGKPGQTITIRCGEHTINGNFAVNNTIFMRSHIPSEADRYLKYGQVVTFTCKGGEEELIPKFSYYGMRYAYVEGLEEGQATKDALTWLEMHSDVKKRGSFSCSNEITNKLYQASIDTVLPNLYYFPTDCPHREKNGWTGDAWIPAEYVLMDFKAEKTLSEWLRSVRAAQFPNGDIPAMVPTNTFGGDCGPVWALVCAKLPYYIYRFTGNKSVILDNAKLILGYLDHITDRLNEDGLFDYGLQDWRDPTSPTNVPQSPKVVTSSMASFDMGQVGAFLFRQAGLDKEAAYAQAFADRMKKNIREHLIDFDTMTVLGNCQTSQSLGIVLGVFEPNEMPAAKARLLEIIHRQGDAFATGQYGYRHLFEALAEMGEYELGYKMMTSSTPRGFGWFIEQGFPTLCESFRNPKWRIADSRCHPVYANISAWFMQTLAGLKINPTATDVNSYEISPAFVQDLTFAEASHKEYAVRWEKVSNGIQLAIKAPKDSHGTIRLPDGYRFPDGTNLRPLNGKVDLTETIILA